MTRVLVRIAKIVDDDVWKNPEAVGAGRELFWPRALKLRSEMIKDGKPVMVRVDHVKDGSRDIGRVTALSDVNDVDGRWVVAHCDVENAPGWLQRSTPASMTWCNLGHREPMPGGWTRHTSGMVTEVSLLSPGKLPAEPGAKVWDIQETPRRTAEVQPLRHPPVAAAAPAAFLRRTKAERDAIESEELRRRQDWLEQHGYLVAFEDVLENLLAETGQGVSLSRRLPRIRSAA